MNFATYYLCMNPNNENVSRDTEIAWKMFKNQQNLLDIDWIRIKIVEKIKKRCILI